jgi:hypothetical protein
MGEFHPPTGDGHELSSPHQELDEFIMLSDKTKVSYDRNFELATSYIRYVDGLPKDTPAPRPSEVDRLRDHYNNLFLRVGETFGMQENYHNAFYKGRNMEECGGGYYRPGAEYLRMFFEKPEDGEYPEDLDELAELDVDEDFRDAALMSSRFAELRTGSSADIRSYSVKKLAVELTLHHLFQNLTDRMVAAGATPSELMELLGKTNQNVAALGNVAVSATEQPVPDGLAELLEKTK